MAVFLCKLNSQWFVNVTKIAQLYRPNINIHALSPRCFQTSVRLFKMKRINEDKYKEKDKIPPQYDLIYRAPMQNYLAAANLITTISFASMTVISAQIYCINNKIVTFPYLIEYGNVLSIEGEDMLLYLVLFLLGNLSIRFIMNRYPLRIYKKSDNYTAILEGHIPFTKRKFDFLKGDVKQVVLKGSPILPWNESLYRVKDRHLILLDDYFRSISELYHMMDQIENKDVPRKRTKPDDDIEI